MDQFDQQGIRYGHGDDHFADAQRLLADFPKMTIKTNNRWLFFWLLAFCVSPVSVDAAEDSLLITVDRQPVTARLQLVSEGRATFIDKAKSEREFDLQKIVRWGSLANPYAVDQVLLTGRSILMGRITQITRDAFVLETDLWGELTLSRSHVVAAIWKMPVEPTEQWKLRDQLWSGKVKEPMLMLRNGDELAGQLIGGDVRTLQVLPTAGMMDLKTEFIATWHRPFDSRRELPALAGEEKETVVGLTDGTQLVTTELRVANQLQTRLRCGVVLGTMPGIRPIEEQLVCYVRPNPPGVVYLSDLSPLGFKHVPFLKSSWDWGADRNVLGGPLASSDRSYYAKGLGMHSTSRLAYELDQAYDEFQAEVGLDATAGEAGSVVFRVFVFNDQNKWEQSFTSPVLRGGDALVPVRVQLNGSRRLALVVDFADRGDVLDRANWLGARVKK